MASEAPPFWWQEADWRAALLQPAAAVYGVVSGRRLVSAERRKVDLPVLCVGNFTVGGSGKTPVAIALAQAARKLNLAPGILSRGYGGSFARPHLVDALRDSPRHVGDEPLLLARAAPVAVTPDRAAGAGLLREQGCNFLIMDDGFQSARIHIDYALIVIDARHGLGNGKVIPAGPLRAPLVDQLRFVDGLLRMGEGDRIDEVVRNAARAGRPVYQAHARPSGDLGGRRFLAFAGIGHPDRFFDSIAEAGGTVVLARTFPDHHVFAADELAELMTAAQAGGLELITTAKDAVRLRGAELPPGFAERMRVLEIDAVFEVDRTPFAIIEDTLAAWRRRRGIA